MPTVDQHLLLSSGLNKKTKRNSHGTQPVTIGRDQGTPCVELQVVVWVLDEEVLRKPAGSKTKLVTAGVITIVSAKRH